ncbi:MAG TPA: DUF2617 family protein [Dactylosporangium sp.]|nr:DUF2617 family protein [Dactylosporangium sp.]
MLVDLDAPYHDTNARDLRFALGAPLLPALRELAVDVGGVRVELRLLGASHQVRCGSVTETVAYLPALSAAVPDAYALPGYRFRAEVRRLGPEAFAAECADLRRRAEAEPHALAGAFPGARDALTVLAARPAAGGAAWWTAHAYPQTGELVLTETTVTLA